jgi:serine protease Do
MRKFVLAMGCAMALTVPSPVRAQADFLAFAGQGSSIGVQVNDLASDEAAKAKIESGVRISSVSEGTPAARAGFKSGDIVVDFDGERIRSVRQFSRIVQETTPNRAVKTTIVRDGARQTLTVTPELGTNFGTIFNRTPNLVTRKAPSPNTVPFPDGNFITPLFAQVPAQLGVSVTGLDDQLATYFGVKNGVLVTSVTPDSPAAMAGLKAGDVIMSVSGRAVDQPSQLSDAVRNAQDGSALELRITRDKKELTIKATLPDRARRERTGTAAGRVRL